MLTGEEQTLLEQENQEVFQQILKILQNHTGVDFLPYKENTLLRRIGRRMGLSRMEDMGQYRNFLTASNEEKTRLYKDIFISVTEFFRDEAAFRSLYENVLPELFERRPDEIRIWCAACCTGEEAYSIAILLYEYMQRHEEEQERIVKIFATDIDKDAVTAGQAGLYSQEKLKKLSKEAKERYFVREGEQYRIHPQIRKYVVFAQHNLLQDAPFYQMDLISCRNMLIYLKPKMQKTLQDVFYRQLKENGYLFLGSGETVERVGTAFDAVDADCRIFQKNPQIKSAQKGKKAGEEDKMPSVLRAPKSQPVKAAKETAAEITQTKQDVKEKPDLRIKQLEESLQKSREELQHMVQELQEKNTQLQDVNEKMSVSNEELQSTSEEIHSINEELQSVNWEYWNKIEELTKANADFDNLLQNAQIGALYIDHGLCIRKITPIMEKMTNLIATDIGRPISHVCFMKEYAELDKDARQSLETDEIIEREVHSDGQIWLLRIRPYYDWQGEKDGVLVIMFDVTKRLEAVQYELKLLNDNLPGGVARMRFDRGLIIEYANQGLYRLMGCTKEEFVDKYRNHYDYIVFPQDWADMKEKLKKGIHTNRICRMEYRVLTKDGGTGWRMMEAQPTAKDNPLIQCIISDITQLKETQQQLDSLIENIPGGILRLSYDGVDVKTEYVSDRLAALMGYEKNMLYTPLKEMEKEGIIFSEKDIKRIKKALGEVLYYGEEHQSEYKLRKQNGEKVWVELRGSIVSRTETSVTVQYTVIDVTQLSKARAQAQQEKDRLAVIVSLTADLIFEYDIKTDTMYYFNQKEGIANLCPVVEHYTQEILHGNLISSDDRRELLDFCTQLQEGKSKIRAELRKRYGDGKYHWIAVKGKGICNEKGEPVKVVGKTIIIDERKEREEALRKLSERDSMTGLYNASTVRELIEKKLAEVQEKEKRYLVVIDVDDFKHINDTMGHLFGDAVIVTFADALNRAFPDGITGRIGGDEFLLYVEKLHFEEIIRKMNLLNAQLKKAYSGEQEQVVVSSSAGIACIKEGLSYDELIRRADSALYYVKQSQKGATRLYEEFMHTVGEALLDNKKPITAYTREVLIQNDDDLVLFALEMFEKVPDIKSVIRAVSDRICRYYGIRDILYFRPAEDGKVHLSYHWGEQDSVQFMPRERPMNEPEWQILLHQHNQEGISVLRQCDLVTESDNHAISMISIKLQENRAQGYMMFTDWKNDRDWVKEKNGLKRLSYILFRRLRQIEMVQKELEETNYIISHDSKTDLLNYTSFLMNAERYVKENPRKQFYLLYSDFSNFQYLNETYGYAAGDNMLKAFGTHLKEKCRHGILFARVTADHFISMHENVSMEELREEYTKICKEFCDKINKTYELCKIVLVSGICEVDRKQDIFAVNIDNANLARKAVKNKTQTLCIPYTEHMRLQSQIQMEISANMESSLEKGEFIAFLQPKVELATGRLAGAEALVRWKKADGSMMCPDQFIPVFEKNGFITKIDFEMLRQVLALQKETMDKNGRRLRISVNFSRQHQENPHLVAQIQEMLDEYQVPGKYLEAEITESVFLYDLEPLNENIQRLQTKGISVSIDDFGSGYSSLNVLSKVQADIIKLDRQFLLDLESGETEKAEEFLKKLIDMIKQLGFRVIAEGVETESQVTLLKAVGCEYAQGYYYAKPMSIEEFAEFARDYVQKHGMVEV